MKPNGLKIFQAHLPFTITQQWQTALTGQEYIEEDWYLHSAQTDIFKFYFESELLFNIIPVGALLLLLTAFLQPLKTTALVVYIQKWK